MVMSWVFFVMIGLSLLFGLLGGRTGELTRAVTDGAREGVELALSLAGPLCLWAGVGRLTETLGITARMARITAPLLGRLFPRSRRDPELAGALSANFCANLLGLGNAATPMGIRAARLLAADSPRAGDQLCRLVVLNTASVQLIPTTVGALRGALGSRQPFDILPAVWLTSLCSASAGLLAAWLLGSLSRRKQVTP